MEQEGFSTLQSQSREGTYCLPSFMPVHNLWKECPTVGTSADQEEDHRKDALEVEDGRLGGREDNIQGSLENSKQSKHAVFSPVFSVLQINSF